MSGYEASADVDAARAALLRGWKTDTAYVAALKRFEAAIRAEGLDVERLVRTGDDWRETVRYAAGVLRRHGFEQSARYLDDQIAAIDALREAR